jgi:hypothetical protein
MIPAWSVVLVALAYLCVLFAIAHLADTIRPPADDRAGAHDDLCAGARGLLHVLDLLRLGRLRQPRRASTFLGIYVGPILVIGFGHRFVARIVEIAKSQNITSIADFVGARYGKSERVAALVCIVAVIGALPYIALQLKAVASSLSVFLTATGGHAPTPDVPVLNDLAFLVAMVLAGFACAFGTRHIDATEHQDGLVLAIAVESLIKLVAFLVLGVFVVYGLFDGAATSRQGGETLRRRAADLGADLELADLPDPDAALLLRRAAAGAAVPHDDRREPRCPRRPPRRLDVPALSHPDQSLRAAAGDGRRIAAARRRHRPRHDRAAAAAAARGAA